MSHASGQDLDRKKLFIITGLVLSPLKLIERLNTMAQSNYNRIMKKNHMIIDPRQIYWQSPKSRNQSTRPHCEGTAREKVGGRTWPKEWDWVWFCLFVFVCFFF